MSNHVNESDQGGGTPTWLHLLQGAGTVVSMIEPVYGFVLSPILRLLGVDKTISNVNEKAIIRQGEIRETQVELQRYQTMLQYRQLENQEEHLEVSRKGLGSQQELVQIERQKLALFQFCVFIIFLVAVSWFFTEIFPKARPWIWAELLNTREFIQEASIWIFDFVDTTVKASLLSLQVLWNWIWTELQEAGKFIREASIWIFNFVAIVTKVSLHALQTLWSWIWAELQEAGKFIREASIWIFNFVATSIKTSFHTLQELWHWAQNSFKTIVTEVSTQ